jgi:hypothetical protein
MSEKEGILHMMASGRWAVYHSGRRDLPVRALSLGPQQPRLRANSRAGSASFVLNYLTSE